MPLQEYMLHYVEQDEDGKEASLYWRCSAENYAHAVEQLEDAAAGQVIFCELVK